MSDDVWTSAVENSAGAVLVTWVHTPKFYELPGEVPGQVHAFCTTPGCSTPRVGPVEGYEAAERAMALHIASVHWPSDD